MTNHPPEIQNWRYASIQGNASLMRFGKIMNFKIMLSTCVKIMNTLVSSSLIYSCQTWILTIRQADHVNATHVLMLRKMAKGGYR